MSEYVGAAMGVAGGIMQLIAVNKGKKAREEEQKRANERLAEMQSRYERLDTSNPYANLENRFAENVYEDLTVNQQQAQLMAQQGAQQRADTLQQLRGTAGASGIAGLAQVMANQGQLQTQQAAASIGQQEARNQQLAAQGQLRVQAGASAIDLAKAKGETISRQWEQSKVATLFGVAQQEKAAADQARQRALNQQIAAYGMIAGGVTQGVGAAQDDAEKLLTMGGGGNP
jgi:hypothetical protein